MRSCWQCDGGWASSPETAQERDTLQGRSIYFCVMPKCDLCVPAVSCDHLQPHLQMFQLHLFWDQIGLRPAAGIEPFPYIACAWGCMWWVRRREPSRCSFRRRQACLEVHEPSVWRGHPALHVAQREREECRPEGRMRGRACYTVNVVLDV